MLFDLFVWKTGLEEFRNAAEKFSDGESHYDIVEGYCQSSPECNEILSLLEAGKRKVSEVCPVNDVMYVYKGYKLLERNQFHFRNAIKV